MIFAASPNADIAAAINVPTIVLDLGLMALLAVVALAIVRMRSLFAVVMLQGVYSLLCATWFVTLDAVDVAFTEAAVGAGISTVLMLGAMLLTDRNTAKINTSNAIGPMAVVVLAGAALLYAVPDMPAYGSATSPANTGVGMEYIATTPADIEIPNVVTAVLASYRGYDTMGETVVIFMAGLGVLLLLGLNGNAGRWEAKVQGQDISGDYMPKATVLEKPTDAPKSEPDPETPTDPEPDEEVEAVKPKAKPKAKRKAAAKKTAAKKTAAKKATTRKTAAKKTTAKKAAPKKTTAKKAAPKKPAAKKTVAKKTTAKKTAAKKTTAKKTAAKRGTKK